MAGSTESDALHTTIRDETAAERAVETVLRAVSEFTGREMKDLPVLHRTIDGDALNRLFQRDDSDVHVEFEYAGYLVSVRSDRVKIFPIDSVPTAPLNLSSTHAVSED